MVLAMDIGHVSVLILLDLNSELHEFDTTDHQTLLLVLDRRFHVQGVALNWFRSYISDRRQSFHHFSEASANYPVDCIVLHGSHRLNLIHRGCCRRHQ